MSPSSQRLQAAPPSIDEVEAVAQAMWDSDPSHEDRPKWVELDRALDAALMREFREQTAAGLRMFLVIRAART